MATYTIAGSGTLTDQWIATYQTFGAAAALPTKTIFTAPVACKVTSVKAIWDVAAGAASTIGIYKDTGTTAAGGGTIILAAAIDVETTARTTNTPALSATAADYTLAAGDRLSVKIATGSATANALVNFTVYIVKV